MDNEQKHADSQLLTVRELAALLHVHPNTIRKWESGGMLKAIRVGTRGDRRFRRDSMMRYVGEETHGREDTFIHQNVVVDNNTAKDGIAESILKDYVNIRQAAKILGIHEESVRRLIRLNELPATKIGSYLIINREHLRDFQRNYNPKKGRRATTSDLPQ